MNRLTNPFEGTSHDPRHINIAVQVLKRGRNGEGRYPLEINVKSMGEVAILSTTDRERIVDAIEGASGVDSAETVGDVISNVIVERIIHQMQDGRVDPTCLVAK